MRFITPSPFHCLIFALVLAMGFPGLTQAQQPTFTGEAEVLAVDLPVTVERGAFGEWLTGKPVVTGPSPEDFELLVDGQPRPVVAVAPPNPEDDPWRFLVWFDLRLLEPEGVRWAATLLGDRAEELTAVGTVEILLVEDAPRRLLAPSRSPEEIREVLSQLALFPEAEHSVLGLRSAYLDELEEDAATADWASRVAVEERRLIEERYDLLLTHLAGDPPAPSGRRALLYVQGGFDLDPETFYGPGAVGEGPSLLPLTRELSRTLAAYGWVSLAWLPPEPELLVEGLRIGKWLVRFRGPHVVQPTEEELDQTIRDEPTERDRGGSVLGRMFPFGLHAKLQEHRDPDLAEAYLELGISLRGEGSLDDSEEALRRALYHFAEDPRTAGRQAMTQVELAAVLAERGDEGGARRAMENAQTLDPEVVIEEALPSFRRREAFAERLAATTSGYLVRGRKDLERALQDLRWRLRLTYQLAGGAEAGPLPLELRFRGREEGLAWPGWSRGATPEAVAAARLRHHLRGSTDGVRSTAFEGWLTVAHRGDGVELQLQGEPAEGRRIVPRLSLARLGEDDGITVEHLYPPPGEKPGDGWQGFLPLSTSSVEFLGFLVEDLSSGLWEVRWLEP